MLSKLQAFARRYDMLQPGDEVVCAVSGGADSVALLLALHLLRDQLGLRLSAAHFNHGLRDAESDRDEAFVRQLCQGMQIPLTCGRAAVVAGEKGLEAAARDARYAFLESLPGKIATAHTADDNAETVLMRMVRGTGLKGLGAIAPVSGRRIRPMLSVTREEVLTFLEEYHQGYVDDSSNSSDDFLRNRLRHYVMPLLKQENPRLAENLSAMALRLRQDEQALAQPAQCRVSALKEMDSARRSRALAAFLREQGVPEPESEHIALVESLVFSRNPSAKADLPGGVRICRVYDRLQRREAITPPEETALLCPGVTDAWGMEIVIKPLSNACTECFSAVLQGVPVVRSRRQGDSIRLTGGTKSLKKLFVDNKIPASDRCRIAVLADDAGVLWVQGFGFNSARLSRDKEAVIIEIQNQEAAK